MRKRLSAAGVDAMELDGDEDQPISVLYFGELVADADFFNSFEDDFDDDDIN